MPETYAQKRQRWQKLAAELPHNLGERVALRNIPAVAALPSGAQETLAAALDQGLASRQVKKAIQVLKTVPEIQPERLLEQLESATEPRHALEKPATENHVATSQPIQTATLSALADLLQSCFPDMVRASAEALAKSPSMAPLSRLLAASQVCLNNPENRSDVTVIVLAGLLQQLSTELDQLILSHPNYQRALQTSGVRWMTITTLRS
jgi:hypothetical protein